VRRRTARKAFAERTALLVAAIATAFGAAASFAGYFDVGTSIKVAAIPLIIGIGYWIFRQWTTEAAFWLPDLWKALVVALLCLLAGTTAAWLEAKPDHPARFEFVVVPQKGEFVLESLAPAPNTEIFPGPEFQYGDHIYVTCYVDEDKGSIWLRLPDRNFLSSKDLRHAPLTNDQPPEC
jgi:hypothetical protein